MSKKKKGNWLQSIIHMIIDITYVQSFLYHFSELVSSLLV